MNYDKKTIRDIDVSGKKILLRCDFNVPHDKTTGIIHDDTRIVSTLPTIRYLLEHNAAVILLSHMGRPHGQWKKELLLFSARDHLEKLLGIPVPLTQDVLGPDTKEKCAALQPGQVVLVENLRFRLEEEQNDPDFSRELASLADLFVFDAFGAAHRAHASTEGVSHYLPSVAGLLVEKESPVHGRCLGSPQAPPGGHPGRGQGGRQDRRHQKSASEGRHHSHRRRHVLHLSGRPGPPHRHLSAGR